MMDLVLSRKKLWNNIKKRCTTLKTIVKARTQILPLEFQVFPILY